LEERARNKWKNFKRGLLPSNSVYAQGGLEKRGQNLRHGETEIVVIIGADHDPFISTRGGRADHKLRRRDE